MIINDQCGKHKSQYTYICLIKDCLNHYLCEKCIQKHDILHKNSIYIIEEILHGYALDDFNAYLANIEKYKTLYTNEINHMKDSIDLAFDIFQKNLNDTRESVKKLLIEKLHEILKVIDVDVNKAIYLQEEYIGHVEELNNNMKNNKYDLSKYITFHHDIIENLLKNIPIVTNNNKESNTNSNQDTNKDNNINNIYKKYHEKNIDYENILKNEVEKLKNFLDKGFNKFNKRFNDFIEIYCINPCNSKSTIANINNHNLKDDQQDNSQGCDSNQYNNKQGDIIQNDIKQGNNAQNNSKKDNNEQHDTKDNNNVYSIINNESVANLENESTKVNKIKKNNEENSHIKTNEKAHLKSSNSKEEDKFFHIKKIIEKSSNSTDQKIERIIRSNIKSIVTNKVLCTSISQENSTSIGKERDIKTSKSIEQNSIINDTNAKISKKCCSIDIKDSNINTFDRMDIEKTINFGENAFPLTNSNSNSNSINLSTFSKRSLNFNQLEGQAEKSKGPDSISNIIIKTLNSKRKREQSPQYNMLGHLIVNENSRSFSSVEGSKMILQEGNSRQSNPTSKEKSPRNGSKISEEMNNDVSAHAKNSQKKSQKPKSIAKSKAETTPSEANLAGFVAQKDEPCKKEGAVSSNHSYNLKNNNDTSILNNLPVKKQHREGIESEIHIKLDDEDLNTTRDKRQKRKDSIEFQPKIIQDHSKKSDPIAINLDSKKGSMKSKSITQQSPSSLAQGNSIQIENGIVDKMQNSKEPKEITKIRIDDEYQFIHNLALIKSFNTGHPLIFSGGMTYISKLDILVTGGSEGDLILWSLDKFERDAIYHNIHKKGVYKIKYNQQLDLLVTSGNDLKLKLWRAGGTNNRLLNTMVYESHKDRIFDFEIIPNKKLIVSTDKDCQLKIWDLNGNQIQSLSFDMSITSVLFSTKDQVLFLAKGNGDLLAFRLNTEGKLVFPAIKTIKSHDTGIPCLLWIDSKNILAAGGQDGVLKLWTFVNNDFIFCSESKFGSSYIRSLSSIGDKYILAANGLKKIRIVDIKTGKMIHSLEGIDNNSGTICYIKQKGYIISIFHNKVVVWESIKQLNYSSSCGFTAIILYIYCLYPLLDLFLGFQSYISFHQ